MHLRRSGQGGLCSGGGRALVATGSSEWEEEGGRDAEDSFDSDSDSFPGGSRGGDRSGSRRAGKARERERERIREQLKQDNFVY